MANNGDYPLENCYSLRNGKWSIETVDLTMRRGGSFHSYVKLPEGTMAGDA